MDEPAALAQAKAPGSNRLSDADIGKVLELLKGSTSIELKLMVENSPGEILARLGFDPVEAEPRQVFFFDTPDLALNKAGVIVRARRSAGGRADTVVKLRPIDPQSISADLRRDPALKIEVDLMPGSYVCSASFKGRCPSDQVLKVCDGGLSLKSILTKTQRAIYAAYAPNGIAMTSLVPLGPTFLLRIRKQPVEFDRLISLELWLYPDGSRVLEISTAGLPEEGFQLAAHFKSYLAACGIPTEAATATKTAKALQYFAERLQDSGTTAS